MNLFVTSVKRCLIFVCIVAGLQLAKADEYTITFFVKQVILFIITLTILSLSLMLFEVVKKRIEKNKNIKHES
jgi:hypothetical protein